MDGNPLKQRNTVRPLDGRPNGAAGGAATALCVYDNRATADPSLRLLIASIAQFHPNIPVLLSYAAADAAFKAWIAAFPQVQLVNGMDAEAGWNVKPVFLLHTLDAGWDEAVWLDSDIVLAGPIPLLRTAPPVATLVVAEEALWGGHDDIDAARARAWGMAVGRTLPFTANSCVVRVTPAHRPLIEAWARYLQRPDYRAAQALPLMQRPQHMVGDQDVLTALLCDLRFADIPVFFLRRGRDVLQIFGLKAYTVRERVLSLVRGLPPIIHSQQYKPWLARYDEYFDGGMRSVVQRIYMDSSPYTLVARRFREVLPGRRHWLKPRTRMGTIFEAFGLGNIALTGLPLAIMLDFGFFTAKVMRGVRSRIAALTEFW